MRNKKLIIIFSILAFVALFIVLSSVIFSVQSVYAYCYNADDPITDDRVASTEVNGISRGRSIFMLDERAIAERVEAAIDDVKVINVERKFPNQVYVNYVKILPYIVFEGADSALYASSDLKILSVGEKQDYYPDHILLKTANGAESEAAGEKLFSPGSDEGDAVRDILSYVERMGLRSVEVELFGFIDVSFDDEIWIGTRKDPEQTSDGMGTVIRIIGARDKLLDKFRLAVSLLLDESLNYRKGGTITVNARKDSGQVIATFDKEKNLYEEKTLSPEA